MRFLIKFLLVVSLFSPQIILAESISFVNKDGVSSLGGSSIIVNLNLSKKNLNAVEGKIFFKEKNLNVLAINVENTSISQWITPPKYNNGEIEFSGLFTDGVLSEKNRLFKIVLGSTDLKYKEINIEGNVKVYINDGKGTEIKIPLEKAVFKVIGTPSKESVIVDKNPPQLVNFSIGKNDEIFNGNYFLMFEIKDKESASIKSEILLSNDSLDPLSLRSDNKKPWKEVSNPTLIDDNKLCSYIYLRLRDEVGNVSVYSIYEPKELSPCIVNKISKSEFFSGIIYKIGAVFVLLILVWRLFLYGKKKSNL